MTALEITKKVREKLAKPEAWCQHAYWRDAKGNTNSSMESAKSCCLLGAYYAVRPDTDVDILAWSAFLGFQSPADVSYFNDDAKHKDIIELLDNVIRENEKK